MDKSKACGGRTLRIAVGITMLGLLLVGSANGPILPEVRFINGTIIDSLNKTGIAGVKVSINTSNLTTTNTSGFYSFAVTSGSYIINASFEPVYYKNSTTVSTTWSEVVLQDIGLLRKPTGNISGSVSSTAGAFSQRMFIPAYFYPGSLWDQATSGAPIAEILVMNPASGPGTSQDLNYVNAVNNTRPYQQVLGYVHTGYGIRDPEEIKTEIDLYISWYNVSGIFLDEVSSNISDIQYYQDLVNYTRSTSGAFVALNPGTIPAEEYIDIGNTTVIFEGKYDTYKTWTPPGWVFNYSPYKFTHLVYNTSTSTNMEDAIKRAQTHNSHYVYVTDDILPNPWDTLPSYWSSELEFVRKETP